MNTLRISVLVLITSCVARGDWPQYHGPSFNNQSTERISAVWPQSGPPELWRTEFNTGFSSLAVAGGHAYTLVRREVDTVDNEGVVAVDADTGKEHWFQALGVANYRKGG